MADRRLGAPALAAYGVFALPLAMAALPLYVHLPKFYADDRALTLSTIGAVLLLTRLADALSDPLIGYWSDRLADRRPLVLTALPLLALGMLAIFNPPESREWRAAWLALTVMMTYLGFSLASIAYHAWGAELSPDTHERTRVTTVREAFALGGVILAAVLPGLAGGENAIGYGVAAWVFFALVITLGLLTLALAPRPRRDARATPPGPLAPALVAPLANPGFRRLATVFLLSGIAAAIPSTLVLFFIADVLGAAGSSGLFLAVYFGAAALGLPFWLVLSRRYGKVSAWIVGMLLAVASFVWAFTLGRGDELSFGIVCALSGVALGADLALPPSILADVIDRDRRGEGAVTSGSYFGLWNLIAKANLALAAGIALPLVGWLGYVPGAAAQSPALSFAYCVIPCLFKLAAAAVLVTLPRAVTLHGADR